MSIFKWLSYLIGIVSPIAALVCVLGIFTGLGGWGWLLFVVFAFLSIFSLSVAQHFDEEPRRSTRYALAILAAVGVAGLFALSDLPNRLSALYMLIVPVGLLIFAVWHEPPEKLDWLWPTRPPHRRVPVVHRQRERSRRPSKHSRGRDDPRR